ncbi:hypothetical protein BMS3Abin13_00564 [bacterium BMS3Abin13]|nr:hypothetical protein BMS3Abin13_00564 [bacterium BMS3Abin13]
MPGGNDVDYHAVMSTGRQRSKCAVPEYSSGCHGFRWLVCGILPRPRRLPEPAPDSDLRAYGLPTEARCPVILKAASHRPGLLSLFNSVAGLA